MTYTSVTLIPHPNPVATLDLNVLLVDGLRPRLARTQDTGASPSPQSGNLLDASPDADADARPRLDKRLSIPARLQPAASRRSPKMASIAFASTETVVQQVPTHIDVNHHDSWDTYMPEMAYNMTLVFNDPQAVDPTLPPAPYPHLLPAKPHVESYTQFPIEQVQVPQVPSQEQIVKPESPLDVPQNIPQVFSYAY
jgi:hypothetical protein